MTKIDRVADVIDNNSIRTSVVSTNENFNSIAVESFGDSGFSLMKGAVREIVRETGMVLSAVDTTPDDNTTRLWFSEPEFGARDLQ